MSYPEVRKEVVSFIYQIWNIYRIQSAGRWGPGRTNCGWKSCKVALWMDVKESIWWRAACCSVYIFVLNYTPRLSGSQDWVSWPGVTAHCGAINVPLCCQLDFVCHTMGAGTWIKGGFVCIHTHQHVRVSKKLRLFRLNQFDRRAVFPPNTCSLTSHACFVRESFSFTEASQYTSQDSKGNNKNESLNQHLGTAAATTATKFWAED